MHPLVPLLQLPTHVPVSGVRHQARGNDINSYDLENGNLTVKADHVLGFKTSLMCQECVVEGYLTLLGTGKFLASSNGPVHFLESPVRVGSIQAYIHRVEGLRYPLASRVK